MKKYISFRLSAEYHAAYLLVIIFCKKSRCFCKSLLYSCIRNPEEKNRVILIFLRISRYQIDFFLSISTVISNSCFDSSLSCVLPGFSQKKKTVLVNQILSSPLSLCYYDRLHTRERSKIMRSKLFLSRI